jgi:hypothetical protein
MKQFSTITPERLRELAFAATYRTSLFGGDANVIPHETLAGFQRFGQAVYDDMKDGTDVQDIMLERFHELAVEHAGFQPYDMYAAPGGIIDQMKLLSSSSQELFYTRLAYQIAAELKREV